MWNIASSQNYVVWLLGGIIWGSDALQVDLSGIEWVVLESGTAGVLKQRLEGVMTDAPEGIGLRPDSEKVQEVEV